MEAKPKHKFGDCEICKKAGAIKPSTKIYYHLEAKKYLCIDCFRAVEALLNRLPSFKDMYNSFTKS